MCPVAEPGCKCGQSCTEKRPKRSCELLADGVTFEILKGFSYSICCSLIRRGHAVKLFFFFLKDYFSHN